MKKMWIRVVLVMMLTGVALMVSSCAKKNLETDMTALNQSTDEISAEATARQAALEKKRALEAQRLQEQALQEQATQARQFEERRQFETDDVQFGYDSAVLNSQARLLLKEKVKWLEENRNRNVVVQGHCDERGTTEYNLALGDLRANAVKSFLMDLGVSGSRITTISYGEEMPLDAGHDEAAWARNRRAHFVLP